MKPDIHPEYFIQPYGHGVKLIKPRARSYEQPTLMSVNDLFSLPILSYFLSANDNFIHANHLTRITNIPGNIGYYSHHELKNAPLNSVFCRHTTKIIGKHTQQILNSKQMLILEENANRLDELQLNALSFKLPVYDSSNHPIAILGLSALFDNSTFPEVAPFVQTINHIIHTGLINTRHRSFNLLSHGISIDNVYLSQQELKCLRLLILGKTSKLIAQFLNLSPRTVEYYLDNIKNKLKVETKTQLIEKVIQHIWPDAFLS